MLPAIPSAVADCFWEEERCRLVALCLHLTGSRMAAEDLAQETLYEAWRLRDRVHDRDGISAWLAAIARNVSLRWRAHQRREAMQRSIGDFADYAEAIADPFDLAAAIEQGETRQVLERALALLPTTTRQALLAHCLSGASFGTLAKRQGVAEATMKMQVQRGKQRLRQILTTILAADATACGLLAASAAGWAPTPLWCPRCGQRHLEGQWDFAVGSLKLRCHECLAITGVYTAYDAVPDLFRGVTGLKAGFNRVMRWVNAFYLPALERGGVACACGHFVPLIHHLPDVMPSGYCGMALDQYRQLRGMHLYCPTCDGASTMMLTNLALYLPVAWRFWSEHQRICTLPEQEIVFQQRPALRLAFQSVVGMTQLDVIVACESYAILAVQQGATRYHIAATTSSQEATA